jgi:hypothetical protein
MAFVETVSFLSDVKSIAELRNIFAGKKAAWNDSVNEIKKVIKDSCNEFNTSLAQSHDFNSVVIQSEYIDDLIASAGKALDDMKLITIDMILPDCSELSHEIKKQLYNKIQTDLHKYSPLYQKLLEFNGIQKIDTNIEQILENTQTLLKQTASNPSHVTTKEAYLPSSFHKTNIDVVGRETDIRTIHNAFVQDNIIALHGDGGIGKSIAAEYYADIFKDEYKAINHLQFSGSVQNTLMSLMEEWELKGYDSLSYDDRWNIIKNNLKNLTYNILIVIHINDESITQLTDYDNLKYRKNVKFLFTTRVKKLPPCRMIEIEPLSDDEIMQIFINNACEEKDRAIIEKEIAEHEEQFNNIVKI